MLQWLASVLKSATVAAVVPEDARARSELGDRGENRAARYLRNKGYKILLRNFDSGSGEIDIIARDGKTIVFVEVKTREADDHAAPEQQVHPGKQHQITKAARIYLSRYGTPQPPARFDVVSIVWPENTDPTITHLQAAFQPTF